MSNGKNANLSNGFLFMYDWLPALNVLSGDEVKILLLALIDRQRNGTPFPKFESELVQVFANMIEPTIERRINGSKGGYKANSDTNVDTTIDTTVVSDIVTNAPSKAKQSKAKAKQIKADIGNAPTPPKKSFGEFSHVLLTDEQHENLINEYGESKTALYILKLDEYIEQTGKKYNSHYITIKTWIRKDDENNGRNERNGSVQPSVETGEKSKYAVTF